MGKSIVPRDEIRFAAQTGFLSKSDWLEFFAYGGYSWKQKRWKSFIENGYFRRMDAPRNKDIYLLNKMNRDVWKIANGTVAAGPAPAHLTHDEILSHSLLTLKRSKVVRSFQTEWELRAKYAGVDKRSSVDERLKYPDLILDLGIEGKRLPIAIELEITNKGITRYRKIVAKYRQRQYANIILYVAPSEKIFTTLRRAIKAEAYINPRQEFATCWLLDWKANPLKAKISIGRTTTTLETLIADFERQSSISNP